MKRPGVPPSVRLSVPLRRVCCCGPGRREISIDCCTAHCSVWAVSRCQPNTEACRVIREMAHDEDGAHSVRLISTACRPPTRTDSSAPLDQSVTKTLVYDDDIACVGQTWNWVIGSPGRPVIILTRCETRVFPVFEKKPKIYKDIYFCENPSNRH